MEAGGSLGAHRPGSLAKITMNRRDPVSKSRTDNVLWHPCSHYGVICRSNHTPSFLNPITYLAVSFLIFSRLVYSIMYPLSYHVFLFKDWMTRTYFLTALEARSLRLKCQWDWPLPLFFSVYRCPSSHGLLDVCAQTYHFFVMRTLMNPPEPAYGSVVDFVFSMQDTLGPIPSTQTKQQNS